MVYGWSKRESITAVDCAVVSLMTLLVVFPLLIIPTVFHVLINRHITLLKFIQPSNRIGDQSLDRSPNGFPQSRAD
jgi:hypothetical protein